MGKDGRSSKSDPDPPVGVPPKQSSNTAAAAVRDQRAPVAEAGHCAVLLLRASNHSLSESKIDMSPNSVYAFLLWQVGLAKLRE